MKESSVFIKGSSNSNIHVLSYVPEKPKAILHILHGMGEYAQRYAHFAQFLTEKGYIVYAHDHRGHGLSLKQNQAVGIFDETDHFEHIIDDVEKVRTVIEKAHPNLPYMMLGHSMGSIILRRYLQVYNTAPVSKAIIMGTLPKYSGAYVKVMRLLANLLGCFKSNNVRHEGLGKLLNDGLIKQIPNPKTKFDWLTYDESNVKKYNEDDLCGYAYNKRFYKSFFKTIDQVNKKQSMLKTKILPTLFIAGLDDPINDKMKAIEKLKQYYLKLYPKYPLNVYGVINARHEVLNETNKLTTYDYILTYLNQDIL